MTEQEWDTIALLIDNCWQGDFDEVRSVSYFTLLNGFTHAETMAALYVLMEDGKPFIPSAPEIVGAVRKLQGPGIPAWSEVWNALSVALQKPSLEEGQAVMLERCGEIAAAFMVAEGFQRLKYVEFFDPEYGAQRIRELQGRWVDFADRSVERLRNGLALASAGSRNGGLLSVNPLAHISAGVSVDDGGQA